MNGNSNSNLKLAAIRYARDPGVDNLEALERAAREFVRAEGTSPWDPDQPRRKGPGGGKLGYDVVRFGRSRGTPLVQASTDDIRWLVRAVQQNIQDPEKARFAEDNEKYLDALTEELAKRGEDA